MRCLVTGCAGFIGSHLCERLIDDGHEVLGIDAFTAYYSRQDKERNIERLRDERRFALVVGNLLSLDLPDLLDGMDVVYHQAAQPGVRSSWGDEFGTYNDNNVLATQRLLEAARDCDTLRAFVYASSSSVYGDAESYPTSEHVMPRPISPYGVTKLAGEHLCRLYHRSYGVPTVSLRYFTVYGPRQRPDMAFRKFISHIMADEAITVYGDGTQTRDFTYVSDAVQANILAADMGERGDVYNIGGGSRISVNDVIDMLGQIVGIAPHIEHVESQHGDVRDTCADISKAQQELGYRPSVRLSDGLRCEVEWAT